MAGVRTRDESLVLLDAGFAAWQTDATGIWLQAAARLAAAVGEVDSELRSRGSRVKALEARLSAAKAGDDSTQLEREIDSARMSQLGAYQALRSLQDVQQQFRAAHRRALSDLEAIVPAARADLRRRLSDISSYRSIGTAGSGAGSGGSTGTQNGSSADVWTSRGIQLVDTAAIDFTDNPVIGSVERDGASLADYRWAVETWDTVVRPGVERGMTRDELVARDNERGAGPRRRTADVYDMFLGDKTNRIRVSRRPDGTYDPQNGRRRTTVARQLGISSLPAEVTE